MTTANAIDVSLTKSQVEFLQLECRFPGFFGGYGCGKSYILGFAAVLDALHSPNALVAVYEPKLDLIRTVAVPTVSSWLDTFGIKHIYNKTEKRIYTESKVCGDFLFRTMEEPESLVGYSVYRSHVDEIDTMKRNHAKSAWGKIVSRNRQKPEGVAEEHLRENEEGVMRPYNKVSAYTTPEGFRFCYEMWKLSKKEAYGCVHGRTEDNPVLDNEYVQSIKDTYPEHQWDAYLNGQFVNMTTGSVWHSYDDELHNSIENIKPKETLHIGCDFNVGRQCAIVWVSRKGGQEFHAIEEMTGMYDTPDMVETIKSRYPGHQIWMYPDASGRNRSAIDADITHLTLLKDAGFLIRKRKKNPLVEDRVLCTNIAFQKGQIFVNKIKCPDLSEALKQHAYDKNNKPEKGNGHDDVTDAASYFTSYRFLLRQPVFNVPIKWMK